jgi:hypothetical protein
MIPSVAQIPDNRPLKNTFLFESIQNSQCGDQLSAVSPQLRQMRNPLFFRLKADY